MPICIKKERRGVSDTLQRRYGGYMAEVMYAAEKSVLSVCCEK